MPASRARGGLDQRLYLGGQDMGSLPTPRHVLPSILHRYPKCYGAEPKSANLESPTGMTRRILVQDVRLLRGNPASVSGMIREAVRVGPLQRRRRRPKATGRLPRASAASACKLPSLLLPRPLSITDALHILLGHNTSRAAGSEDIKSASGMRWVLQAERVLQAYRQQASTVSKRITSGRQAR